MTVVMPWSLMIFSVLRDLLDDHRGEALVGLVEQQHLDVARQRPGDGQHLLLAARQGHALLLAALARRGKSS